MEEELKTRVREEIKLGEERLKAAKLLLDHKMLKDAVNRIYYAIFHTARAMLHSSGFDAKTHSGLISQFGLQLVKQGKVEKKYGRILRKSFETRETSNYKVGSVFEHEEVEDLYEEAEDFMKRAQEFVNEKIAGDKGV